MSCSSIPQGHPCCFLFSCQDFRFKLCYCVSDSRTPRRAEHHAARLWVTPRHQASPWPPRPLQSLVTSAVTSESPFLPTITGVLAVWKVRSSTALGCGPRCSARAVASDTRQTLSPPGSFGLKETIVFEILSLRCFVWLQGKQQLLVEGDTGLASRWVQDFVVRTRARAQPGLVAVSRGFGHRLLRAARVSRAALPPWLFSRRGARCGWGIKSACVRGGPVTRQASSTYRKPGQDRPARSAPRNEHTARLWACPEETYSLAEAFRTRASHHQLFDPFLNKVMISARGSLDPIPLSCTSRTNNKLSQLEHGEEEGDPAGEQGLRTLGLSLPGWGRGGDPPHSQRGGRGVAQSLAHCLPVGSSPRHPAGITVPFSRPLWPSLLLRCCLRYPWSHVR